MREPAGSQDTTSAWSHDTTSAWSHQTVLAHTVVTSPWLCPELRMHLVTEACPLWRATEPELLALGLPEPYWAFAWAGGQALARYLLDHPEVVRGKRVLDFGAGGGVEALAALRSGATHVLASDLDPVAGAALELNAALCGVEVETTTADLIGATGPWDLILAGDVCYDPDLARRLWAWLEAEAARGVRVLVGDPGRGNVPLDRATRVFTCDAPSDVDVEGRYLRSTSVFALGSR